ncbi:hypothetical protein PtrEW4_006587 [Pyrenophora tritici-repentis]|nr:hypothetical protein PtrEW4_006587 [Pyrenophora tritici-repentis]
MPHSNASNGLPREGYLNLTRRMENEEDDQFDVDLTILDFLVYKAIGLVFEWRSSSDPYHSDLPNALVNMTAGKYLPPSIPTLANVFEIGGRSWDTGIKPFDQQKDFPLSDGALYENRSELASALGMPLDQRRWVTDVAGTPSLHCLLPVFIELTAARVNLDDDWVPSSEWFDLAGQFMLQAVIGEYLRNGAYGEETFNTIFAYGCPGVERWAEEPADVAAMRRLFCDEGNLRQENRAWTTVKRQYIKELLPQSRSQTSLQALEAAQRRYPYAAFEEQLLSFLKYLHDGLVKPDLAQVEEGRINIDGTELSEADSRAMIQRMGL